MANQPDEVRPPIPDQGGTPQPPEAVTRPAVPETNPGEENLTTAPIPAEAPSSAPPVPTPASSETEAAPVVPPIQEPVVPEVHAGESGAVQADPHALDPYHEPHHDSYHELGAHHDEHGHYHDDTSGHHSGGGGLVPYGDAPAEPEDPLLGPPEEGGGPVKTFLEHLEDFRWLLIKCAVAIGITMTVCLLGVNYLVAMMKWPIKRAALIHTDSRQWVSVMLGPKEVLNFRTDTNTVPGFLLATNKYIELELVPLDLGSNRVVALQLRKFSDKLPPEKELPLLYKGPADPFLASLHLAFFGGLLIAAPFVFYYIAQFLLPALRPKERKYFLKAMTPAVILFIAGVCMCYFGILPIALKAAEKYSQWMGVDMQFWLADDYFSFVTKFMLGMGLGFEMPVILLALVKIGLLDYKKLASFRRYMVLINLVMGAVLTTPEVVTQVLMFFPLQFLYEITIWIAWYWEQPDRALARRRAAGAIMVLVLGLVLLWLGVKYGWPWLRQVTAKP